MHDVAVNGDLAFVASSGAGLAVLDLADPDAPATIGSAAIGGEAAVVVSSSDHLIVTDDTFELKLFDVSDPTQPQIVGTYGLPEIPLGLATSDHYAYVSVPGWGVAVFDIRNPASPQYLGTAAEIEVPGKLVASHPWVYVHDEGGGVAVMDSSDPHNPHVVWTYPDGGDALALRGNLLYATGGSRGLLVFDVTDPTAPILRAEADIPGAAVDLTVDGDVLFAPGEGLHVFDLSDPEEPVFIVTVQSDGWPSVVAGSERRVYQAAEFGGLQIFFRHCPSDPGDVIPPALPAGWAGRGLAVVPNPINPRTTVSFELAAACTADLTVYDACGRRLVTLAHGKQSAGEHAVPWAGVDASGRAVPPGVYFIRLEAGGVVQTSRVVCIE